MLAGLAVGTNWKDSTGKHRQITKAIDAQEHGFDFIRLQFKTGGSVSAETLYVYIKTGEWVQKGPEADRCVEFIDRYENSHGVGGE
jgi:hypothetical protein